MALNFPDSPTLNQVYTDATSGFSYQWDGVVWQSYTAPASKNISILDDISGSFNGSTQTFALAVSGTALTPANAQQLRVVLGGVVQEPLTDYTVSGSDITFTTPPTGGLDCSIVSLGPAVSVSVPGDGTVTPVKLSTGGPSWNTDGDVYIAGVTTVTNASGTVTIGIGTTALLVEGNARVTGILTVGTSSITLDGSSNEIKIGAGITISSTGITGSASTVTSASVAYGLTGTPDVVVGISTVNTTLSLVGNYIEDVNAVEALDIDCSAGNYFTKTINGDSTFTVSNVPASGAYAFTLELTHTSGTVTWFSGVEWPASTAPTLTTGKTHLFMFLTDNGGTRWRGSSLVDYTN